MNPRTEAGKRLLDWMEYIRDPETYQPGNAGRGPHWDDDTPLILAIEAEAAASVDRVGGEGLREALSEVERWLDDNLRDTPLHEMVRAALVNDEKEPGR